MAARATEYNRVSQHPPPHAPHPPVPHPLPLTPLTSDLRGAVRCPPSAFCSAVWRERLPQVSDLRSSRTAERFALMSAALGGGGCCSSPFFSLLSHPWPHSLLFGPQSLENMIWWY